MDERGLIQDADCVEAELVQEGGSGPGPGTGQAPRPGPLPPPGLFTRLKRFIGGALLVLAMALLVIGLLLTSTVIGAILGIPLMLAGAALLVLFFRLFAADLRNFVIVRKFP